MTEPDMTIEWQPATYTERILLDNGRLVDVEWPARQHHQKYVWDEIWKLYGPDVKRAGSIVINPQQELL